MKLRSNVSLSSLLVAIAALTLTNCAHDKDEDGIPPKYKPREPRDPVEQRVFYDGWGDR